MSDEILFNSKLLVPRELVVLQVDLIFLEIFCKSDVRLQEIFRVGIDDFLKSTSCLKLQIHERFFFELCCDNFVVNRSFPRNLFVNKLHLRLLKLLSGFNCITRGLLQTTELLQSLLANALVLLYDTCDSHLLGIAHDFPALSIVSLYFFAFLLTCAFQFAHATLKLEELLSRSLLFFCLHLSFDYRIAHLFVLVECEAREEVEDRILLRCQW